MGQQFHSFPSIKQFRNVVDHVRKKAQFKGLNEAGEPIMDRTAKAPTLNFEGRVKLHGTNAAIVFTKDSVQYQSRERILTLEQDNAAFMFHMQSKQLAVSHLYSFIANAYGIDQNQEHTIAVYGEWCGGNIQKNVAITGLDKMFVIFAVKVNDEWVCIPQEISSRSGFKEAGIYSIDQFPKWQHSIDFENPEHAQNFLGQLTLKVEERCPVGLHFGKEGIGEGIVWRCAEDPSSEYWFKVKGEKHSSSAVKTLAAVDVEAVAQVKEFIEKVLTESRLEQGLHNLQNEQLKPFAMESMGDFIRWVHTDVLKEEGDTMLASKIEPKELSKHLAPVARRWFVEQLNTKELT